MWSIPANLPGRKWTSWSTLGSAWPLNVEKKHSCISVIQIDLAGMDPMEIHYDNLIIISIIKSLMNALKTGVNVKQLQQGI